MLRKRVNAMKTNELIFNAQNAEHNYRITVIERKSESRTDYFETLFLSVVCNTCMNAHFHYVAFKDNNYFVAEKADVSLIDLINENYDFQQEHKQVDYQTYADKKADILDAITKFKAIAI